MTAHWGIEDPAAVEGEGQARAFRNAFLCAPAPHRLFLALPFESIDEMSLQTRLHEIGRTRDRSAADAPPFGRRIAAEGIGSFFLFACVIGSGIMAERLSAGNDAVALLGNTLATGAMLFVLITMLGPIRART